MIHALGSPLTFQNGGKPTQVMQYRRWRFAKILLAPKPRHPRQWQNLLALHKCTKNTQHQRSRCCLARYTAISVAVLPATARNIGDGIAVLG